jgi:hypothetical protein
MGLKFFSFLESISNRCLDSLFADSLTSGVEISHTNFKVNTCFHSVVLITLSILPMVHRPFTLPCFLISIFIKDNRKLKSSPSLLSSFIFWENQVTEDGKIVTAYNVRNILLAGLTTSALATVLGYFIFGNEGRIKITSALPSINDFSDLKTNCLQVAHIHKTLVKFVGEVEKNQFPPMDVQQDLVGWIHSDLRIMKDFLETNENWIVLWGLQDKSTMECLNNLRSIGPLYVQACASSPVLKLFCESLNKE